MAKNTNPLTKNLLIKKNWSTISLPVTDRVKHGSNELIKEKFIKEIISGSFMKLGVLTSEIRITKNCVGENTIQWKYFPINSQNAIREISKGPMGQTAQSGLQGEYIITLIKVLKRIIKIKEPKANYKLVCVKAANKFVDGKILNDYINNMVVGDPKKLKNVVNALIKEYKRINQKKYDTTINKSQNNR